MNTLDHYKMETQITTGRIFGRDILMEQRFEFAWWMLAHGRSQQAINLVDDNWSITE